MPVEATCRWCTRRHPERFMCPPAKKILDALYARGMEGNMPTIEFPEPIPADKLNAQFGLGPDTRLLRQVVVQAATVDAAGVSRPMLVFTGLDVYDQPLPKWLYAADADDLARLVQLVTDMADLATRTAARAVRDGR